MQHSGQAVRDGALSACRDGRVLVNGSSAPGRAIVNAGDLITVRIPNLTTATTELVERKAMSGNVAAHLQVSAAAVAPRRRMVVDRASLASQVGKQVSVLVCLKSAAELIVRLTA